MRLVSARLRRLFGGRFYPVLASAGVLLSISVLTRLALLATVEQQLPLSFGPALGALGVGVVYDIVVATYFCLPLGLWLALVPLRVARWRLHRAAMVLGVGVFSWLMVYNAVSEWIFWGEYGARYNFIAVDYLIYTREVVGNIRESFPVGLILSGVTVVALLITWRLARPVWRGVAEPASGGERLGVVLVLVALSTAFTAAVSADDIPAFDRDEARELSGNGVYQLVSAFRNSALDFRSFYATLPVAEALSTVRSAFREAGDRPPAQPYSAFERLVIDPEHETPLNVVLVSIESLGADYVGSWGDTRGLTPNLDRLAGESLAFTQVFATGNRTVRGLEALSLALPPTPGEAIVKRPGASELFTLGSVLADRGYESLFLYGGYGYFDNMNGFFSANRYRVVDRRAIAKENIHHETIWGVADEDLFDLTLQQLDRVHKEGKPFFAHVMTTSNHRPYTYPPDRIDIPSGTGREGAVKYTDYALGRFIESAKSHAWFNRTLFVITADHGANARGTFDIPVEQYRIPLIFFAPGLVAPGRFERLMSQIDIVPTLLGRMHLSYRTKFFGRDVLRAPPETDRAFIGNYQALGYLRDGRLITLLPHRQVRVREFGQTTQSIPEQTLSKEAIAWYQMASQAWTARDLRDDHANTVPVQPAVAAGEWQPVTAPPKRLPALVSPAAPAARSRPE